MKKALVAAAAYAGVGVVVELLFIYRVKQRFPAAKFPMSSALLSAALWPATLYKIGSGQTVLSLPPGAEPTSPGAFGAIPRNAVDVVNPSAAAGRLAARGSDGAAEGVTVWNGR